MVCYVCGCLHESILYMEECLLSWASYYRHVRLAYQPLANSTFLSDQTSHQQTASSTFLSQQISTSHQPNEQAIRASKKGEVLVTHKLGLYQADGLIPRQHPPQLSSVFWWPIDARYFSMIWVIFPARALSNANQTSVLQERGMSIVYWWPLRWLVQSLLGTLAI
jgi:hypothetical protein